MKKYNFFKFIFVGAFIQFESNAVSNSNSEINKLTNAFMELNKIEGMSLAVINNDKIVINNYGFSNKSERAQTTSNTIYTIASFTKTITGTLAAVASIDGKLNLDAPFVNYFSELKNNKNLSKITSSELLAHVSSFPFDFNPRPKTYSALVSKLNEFKGNGDPGKEYSYSNAGIGTMGYVLQNIYAKNYQEILEDKMLRPLNMNSTYLNVPKDKEKYIALGHDKNNNPVPYSSDIEAWFAAASLKSTISDITKYLNAHINYSSIKDANLSKAILLAHENKYCFEDKISCEQLAWQAHIISELENSVGDTYFNKFDKDGNPTFASKKIIENKNFVKNKIFIDKTGSGYGMSSYMAYIPEDKIGVVILINKSIGDERIKLGRDILRIYSSSIK
ncbi:serine hydrolase [Fluviispira multicolorata]|uniref:Serine hydrolase n=1 Tax=Fluviispira multicolorata TaxID=2654512 RepID=A0A833JBC5_9BACT|nr:serine hydrolase [Fluviispira multicolorata]KAB8028479.1 serine hydrolase [Fluviispira multicolorata]